MLYRSQVTHISYATRVVSKCCEFWSYFSDNRNRLLQSTLLIFIGQLGLLSETFTSKLPGECLRKTDTSDKRFISITGRVLVEVVFKAIIIQHVWSESIHAMRKYTFLYVPIWPINSRNSCKIQVICNSPSCTIKAEVANFLLHHGVLTLYTKLWFTHPDVYMHWWCVRSNVFKLWFSEIVLVDHIHSANRNYHVAHRG